MCRKDTTRVRGGVKLKISGPRNQFGFSLAEILIAMGISSIVALGSTYILTGVTAQKVKVEHLAETKGFVIDVERFIINPKDSTTCTNILSFSGPIAIATLTGAVGVAPTITLPNQPAVRAPFTMPGTNLTVTRLNFANGRLIGRDSLNNSVYLAELYMVVAQRKASGEVEKRVPLGYQKLILNQANSFVDCVAPTPTADAGNCARINKVYDAGLRKCVEPLAVPDSDSECAGGPRLFRGVDKTGQKLCDDISYVCSRSNATNVKFLTGFDANGFTRCVPDPALNPGVYASDPAPPPEGIPPGVSWLCDPSAVVNCPRMNLFRVNPTILPTPSPVMPGPTPTPPVALPAATSCDCNGTVILNGRYCGYCYTGYKQYLSPGVITDRQVYQCVSGVLTKSTASFPSSDCEGKYISW